MNLPLAAAVLAASLLGSAHCAGMCGPFVMLATGTDRSRPNFLAALGAYHLGRLTTYLVLGLTAGLAGLALNRTGQLWGLQQVGAYVAGCAMLLIGSVSLLRLLGVPWRHFPVPRAWVQTIHAGFRRAALWSPTPRAWWIGALTTWLPCGWLYAFLLIAAGAGSLANALLLMTAFWFGSLPLLSLLGWGAAAMAPRWRTALPWVSAAVMLLVGTWTIAARASADPARLAAEVTRCPSGNEQVEAATHAKLPCCHAD